MSHITSSGRRHPPGKGKKDFEIDHVNLVAHGTGETLSLSPELIKKLNSITYEEAKKKIEETLEKIV